MYVYTALKFIGPKAKTMRQLGDKASARHVAMEAGVPVVPATEVLPDDMNQVRKMADEVGYPFMLKASWGGGGRGMRPIMNADELEEKVLEGRREAEAAFANALSEMRKFKLGIIASSQFTSSLGSKVFESIMGNVGTIICFRIGATDAPLLSKQLGRYANQPEDLNPAVLTELPNHKMFVRLMINGVVSKVFSAQTRLGCNSQRPQRTRSRHHKLY